MHSHRIYIVATTKNIRDVNIQSVYDAELFTIDTILAGLKKQLKGQNYHVSQWGDDAYIDIIDDAEELVKTYTITSKLAMFNN